MSVIARATVTLAAVSDGVGVSAVTAYYAAGASATEKPSSPSTAEWSTSPPDIGDEEYLWMAYLITYTSGTTAWTEPCCLSDASTREAMLEVKETSAKVYELAESVLIAAVETDSVWYTKSYTITATSCGLPADEGYAATDYSGKYYLDQTTGYVYLSDGYTWEYVEALKSTTETLEGSIETSAGEVRLYVDDAIEGISVGGTNLLPGTKDFSSGIYKGEVQEETYLGFTVISLSLDESYSGAASNGNLCLYKEFIEPEAGEQYTLSFYAKGSGTVSSFFYTSVVSAAVTSQGVTTGQVSNGAVSITLSDTWTRYWVTWTVRDDVSGAKNLVPMRVLAGTTGYICGVKFEKGNVPTDWSPAPEDAEDYTDSKISASLVLSISEEDGVKYGVLSANADRIKLSGSELEIETDDFTLKNGSAVFSGALEAATGTFSGELNAASGTFAGELQAASGTFDTITGGVLMSENYVAGESGIYIDLDNGILDCASLTASISDSLLLTVSQTYATLEDYNSLASTLDQAVVSVVAYFAISDSADKYPELEAAGGAASYAGVARAGQWLAGFTGWITEMPVYEDGDYVWMSYLKTYADGSTEWTEPALIVDGSVSERIVSMTETTASIQVLTDSILQTVASTSATWYTGDYTIAATSCGTPADAGCSASLYEGLYYLDQTTGYVYLSDGSSWEKVAELDSTVSTMQTLVENTESSIKSTVSSWVGAVTVYYGTCATDSDYSYKTVECDSFDADSLVAGASIRITFANGNTAYPLLLNINGTGNIPAYVNGANFTADSDTWGKNATAVFEYDGTVWNLVETGSYAYTQTLVKQTAETWSATLTEDYATKASLALTLAEETDEDGTKHTYGTLSGYAEYIKFESKEFIVDAGNFSIDADSTVRAGGFTVGETALYNGTESLNSKKDGVYVGTDGIRLYGDSGALTISDGILTMRSNAGIVCTNSEGTRVTLDDAAYYTARIGDGYGISIYTDGYEDKSKDLVGRFDISTDQMTASSASTSDWFTINNLSEAVTINGKLTVSGTGRIGEWTTDEYQLYSGLSSLTSEESGVYISADTGTGGNIGIRMNSDDGFATLTPGAIEVKSTEAEITTDCTTGYPFMKWDGGLYLGVGDRSAAVCTAAHGKVSSVNVGAGEMVAEEISFGTTFPGIPTVVACLMGKSASGDGDYGNLTVSVISSTITDTGCTIYVSNAGSSSRSPGISWAAIY